MSNYPTLPQLIGSKPTSDAGIVVEASVSGKPRFRKFFTQTRKVFSIMHEVDGPDKDTLLAHFEADVTNAFNFTFKGDGLTYSVRYGAAVQAEPIAGTDRWVVSNTLVVV